MPPPDKLTDDLFDASRPPTRPVVALPDGFDTISRAHAWMDREGWKPRHGGGYDVGARFAVMLPRNATPGDVGVILEFRQS